MNSSTKVENKKGEKDLDLVVKKRTNIAKNYKNSTVVL